jgi:hypothetical protein
MGLAIEPTLEGWVGLLCELAWKAPFPLLEPRESTSDLYLLGLCSAMSDRPPHSKGKPDQTPVA